MADIKVKIDDLEAAAGKHVAATEENPVTRIAWTFDGTAYVIDLTEKNRVAFEAAIKPYREASRVPPRRSSQRPSSRQSPSTSNAAPAKTRAAEVRKWLAAGRGKPATWQGDKGPVSGHSIVIDGKSYRVGPRGQVDEAIWKLWEKETGRAYAVNGSEPAATAPAASPAGQGTQPANAS